ncbi:MAG: guanylate kinase [Clostridia bacterium BRH_c25]|nr:MAG: guanylate kinase [Clostridia bacterium BRH_c25]
MNSKGLLIVISGPSGAGKGTICRELLHGYSENLELSVSATTRKPREGEVEGVNYFFMEKQEFIKMVEDGEFIEYAKVHDNYYGTPKKYVMDKLEEGKNVILEIDVQGGMKLKHVFDEAVFVFIMPPSFKELRKRIEGRGTETEQDICKRMKNAYGEISYVYNYDYVVVNDDLRDAAGKINCILTAEKCRIKRCNIDFENFREG